MSHDFRYLEIFHFQIFQLSQVHGFVHLTCFSSTILVCHMTFVISLIFHSSFPAFSGVHGFVHLTLFQFNSPSHLLDKHVTGSEAIDLTCMGITVIQQCNHSCLLHQLLSVRHISTFLCVSCSLWLI